MLCDSVSRVSVLNLVPLNLVRHVLRILSQLGGSTNIITGNMSTFGTYAHLLGEISE
eukprot:SAG11_NODE_1304_length_5250_cov_5.457581_5_plen_57_part_00